MTDVQEAPKGGILHTHLRGVLETGYDIPRSAGRIVLIIEDGKPLQVQAEFTSVEREAPDYASLAARFEASRLEKATPSPFKTKTPQDVRHDQAIALAGPLPPPVSPASLMPPKQPLGRGYVVELTDGPLATPALRELGDGYVVDDPSTPPWD